MATKSYIYEVDYTDAGKPKHIFTIPKGYVFMGQSVVRITQAFQAGHTLLHIGLRSNDEEDYQALGFTSLNATGLRFMWTGLSTGVLAGAKLLFTRIKRDLEIFALCRFTGEKPTIGRAFGVIEARPSEDFIGDFPQMGG